MRQSKIYIIAGEASGDNIGAKLMRELKTSGRSLAFYGLGGDKMIAEGLTPIFPMQDISIMGFAEIVPKIPMIWLRIKQITQDIIKRRPDILITIDSFGFNKRVVKKVRAALGNGIKIVHYVAPTVWAYKPKRAFEVAKLYDLQLLILPFEKPYFETAGVRSEYVGNPVIESIPDDAEAPYGKEEYNIPANAKVLLIMVGSRIGEVKRLAPIFAEALQMMRSKIGDTEKIVALLPTLPHLRCELGEYFGKDCVISSEPRDKITFFSLAECAMVKSGTSSLEMMKWNIPCVVAYKVNPLSYAYLKRVVKVRFISIVNIILNRMVVPEFIQTQCTPKPIATQLYRLMFNPKLQQRQEKAYGKVVALLGGHEKLSPSKKAAMHILELL